MQRRLLRRRIKGAKQIKGLMRRAMPVAMGGVVTSLLGEIDMQSGFTMLGIGLACAGVYLLKRKD